MTTASSASIRATLGGLDHASAAVVGPSDYVKTQRPDVIYIGGLDGQLHALYLRGTQPNFSPPQPGTELWAFIPRGQLSRLRTNNARVDVSPVVTDVYVDYADKDDDGVLGPTERNTGLYSWRTVLISGSGRLGGEIFALDVTNPLKPIVLWDVTASVDNTNDPLQANNTALHWKDQAGVRAPDYKDLAAAGHEGPYNYTDLGDSLEMNLVPVRRGNRPSFQVIVSTNGARLGAQRECRTHGLNHTASALKLDYYTEEWCPEERRCQLGDPSIHRIVSTTGCAPSTTSVRSIEEQLRSGVHM